MIAMSDRIPENVTTYCTILVEELPPVSGGPKALEVTNIPLIMNTLCWRHTAYDAFDCRFGFEEIACTK